MKHFDHFGWTCQTTKPMNLWLHFHSHKSIFDLENRTDHTIHGHCNRLFLQQVRGLGKQKGSDIMFVTTSRSLLVLHTWPWVVPWGQTFNVFDWMAIYVFFNRIYCKGKILRNKIMSFAIDVNNLFSDVSSSITWHQHLCFSQTSTTSTFSNWLDWIRCMNASCCIIFNFIFVNDFATWQSFLSDHAGFYSGHWTKAHNTSDCSAVNRCSECKPRRSLQWAMPRFGGWSHWWVILVGPVEPFSSNTIGSILETITCRVNFWKWCFCLVSFWSGWTLSNIVIMQKMVWPQD